MKTLLIIFFVFLVPTLLMYTWRKITLARMESEINRIRIPDDTFEEE
jgi:hypothetical protein